jgi:heptosyltransferase-1
LTLLRELAFEDAFLEWANRTPTCPGELSMSANPRRVLIVKLSAIGDVLHMLPAAVALRKALPETEITWAAEGRTAEFLRGHPAVDHVVGLRRRWLTSPPAVLQVRKTLRALAPDVAIDSQGLLKSGVLSWLSGAGMRIGYAAPEAREGSAFFATHRVAATAGHVVERHLELLTALGITPAEPRFGMPRPDDIRRSVDGWWKTLALPDAPAVINPGAGWASKLWPPERFAVVARQLGQKHGLVSLVVWGSGSERDAAERIVAASHGEAVLAPATSLKELAEVAARARVFISSDTGPLHLAAAMGTPCVGLFGPVPAARNGPYGAGHVAVEPPPEVRPAWKDRKRDTRSMLAIDAERVVAAALQLIKRVAAA